MRNTRLIAAALFASLLVPAIGRADPFNPKRVPAEAKWVLHVDLDAARDTKALELVRQNVLSTANAMAKLEQIETLTGTKLPDDLHDVTLYGKDAGEEAGVVLVHGKLDPKTVENWLQTADQYASNPYGNYAIFTWLDKEKNQTNFAAFHDDSDFIIGRTEANIQATLDAMDGKTASLKADSPLAAGVKPQLLLYVAARDIPQLHGGKPNPIVDSIESAWISISEKEDTITLRAQLIGESPDTAKDLQTSLDGLKGALKLVAKAQDADPVAKAAAAASKTFATTQQDQSVLVEWPISVDQVTSIVKAIVDKQAAKN